MNPFYENLAHFIHGAAFMFFILASIQLYPLRHRSNMMRLLFCSMIFLAFLEFKDMGFLIKGVWYNPYITSITMSTDMLYVPLMALFFFEVISPGWVTLRRIVDIHHRLDLYLSVIPKTFGYRNAEYVQIIYAET